MAFTATMPLPSPLPSPPSTVWRSPWLWLQALFSPPFPCPPPHDRPSRRSLAWPPCFTTVLHLLFIDWLSSRRLQESSAATATTTVSAPACTRSLPLRRMSARCRIEGVSVILLPRLGARAAAHRLDRRPVAQAAMVDTLRALASARAPLPTTPALQVPPHPRLRRRHPRPRRQARVPPHPRPHRCPRSLHWHFCLRRA